MRFQNTNRNTSTTGKIHNKQKELEQAEEEISSTRKISELENELQTTKIQTSIRTYETQFALHRDNMNNAYNEMLKTLKVLADKDPGIKEYYRKEAHQLLERRAGC